jgi:hypothetical protein
MVSLHMQLIYLRADPPHQSLTAIGKPGLKVGMFKIGILTGQVPLPLDDQWWNPTGIAGIKRPGQFNEASQLTAAGNRHDP